MWQTVTRELHRVLREEHEGMWFSWWFEELTEAATAQIREEAGSRDGAWELPWRLLHGLTSIGSPALQSLDNWVRARRRIHDLAAVLRKRGMPLPAVRSLCHDLDTDPMARAFTDWYTRRYGTEPDPAVVGALAEEWIAGTLPDTWHAASPHRAQFQLALINSTVGSLSPQAAPERHRTVLGFGSSRRNS